MCGIGRRMAVGAFTLLLTSYAFTQIADPRASTQPGPQAASTVNPPLNVGNPDEVLAQLASPDWHMRRAAGERLVEGGIDAKPFIRDLVQRATNDEARNAALAALARIDENRLVGPSYITLHLKDAPPAAVFAELSRQCFAPLATLPDNLWTEGGFPTITLDVEHQPFWTVAPQICRKLGVDFRPVPNGMRIMRSGGMQADGVVKVEGAFLVTANQLSYSRTRSLIAGGGEQTQFGMSFTIYPEPKLVILRSSGEIQVDRAVDDHGNSLVLASDQRQRFFTQFGGSGGLNMYAALKYPKANPGTRIEKLRGSTRFVLQTESQTIEFRDNLAGLSHSTRTISGMKVTFEEMKKNGDNWWLLRLRVDQPNFAGPEWQELVQGAQSMLQIFDSEGNALDHHGMSTKAENGNVELSLDFARGNLPNGHVCGEPVRLTWLVTQRTREVLVPIEFDHLPMFDEK